jgi:hypothetical protein
VAVAGLLRVRQRLDGRGPIAGVKGRADLLVALLEAGRRLLSDGDLSEVFVTLAGDVEQSGGPLVQLFCEREIPFDVAGGLARLLALNDAAVNDAFADSLRERASRGASSGPSPHFVRRLWDFFVGDRALVPRPGGDDRAARASARACRRRSSTPSRGGRGALLRRAQGRRCWLWPRTSRR